MVDEKSEAKKEKIELQKINDYTWKIEQNKKEGMKVSVFVYASEKLLEDMKKDKTLEQAKNVAKLPGIVKASFVMPDGHMGYGYSIGGVAAFDIVKGVISPGGVGYDIDCSVRILSTNIKVEDFMKKRKEILHSIFRSVPSGVGRGSSFNITFKELDKILFEGAEWAVKRGFGTPEDLSHLEDGGKLVPCNPMDVSERAKKRGIGQIGTLGSGNHFLEIQKVGQIFDKKTAEAWGINENNIVIMIHCGSRGLGHQVASDYIKLMEDEYGWPDFDRELVNAPIKSELGRKYLSAMNCAANFSFANKQVITHNVRQQLKHFFPYAKVETIYEVCHNIAKIEEHNVNINGKKEKKKLCVCRKGATRCFENQPVIIPGSMGTASYLLLGNKNSENLSFSSTCHGAGRVESRTSARRELTPDIVKKQLEEKDIIVEAGSMKGLVEEAPEVYKNVDEVVKVSHELKLATLVARLVPLAVMKG